MKLSVGESKPLIDAGPFHISVKCQINQSGGPGDGTPAAGIAISSDVDDTLVNIAYDDSGSQVSHIEAGKDYWSASPVQAWPLMASPEQAILVAPDGRTLNVRYLYGQNALGTDCFASAYAVG